MEDENLMGNDTWIAVPATMEEEHDIKQFFLQL